MNELNADKPDALEINLLLDFYGQLLTDRSRESLDMHYGEDLSLAEIADQLAITRQAVHDRIHQGLRSLSRYETRLGLVARFRLQQQCIADAIRDMDRRQYEAARQKLLQLSGLL